MSATRPSIEEQQRDRREERAWQNEIGADLLDVPFTAAGSAAVFERQWERIAGALAGAPPGAVVEVGCGKGHLLAWLQRRLGDRFCAGLDLSHAVRALPPQGLAGALADGEQLPLRSASVAALIYDGALHHLIDYPAGLVEAARVLRPGGVLVLFEPVSSPFTRLMHRVLDPIVARRAVQYESPIDQRYKHAFDETVITRALDAQGMTWSYERTDVLAYPLTGCYAGSPFARHEWLLRGCLALERRLLAVPGLRRAVQAFAWRMLICARKP
ncbi:MAG: class I SAM-dependent methyltransferase [Candidatus Binatia bacterium]